MMSSGFATVFSSPFLFHQTRERLHSFHVNLTVSRPYLCLRIGFPRLGNIFHVELGYACEELDRFFSIIVQPSVSGSKRLQITDHHAAIFLRPSFSDTNRRELKIRQDLVGVTNITEPLFHGHETNGLG